eukprot:TRINITY_DN30780_c0_g1_i1.p1 TRINITY_DN30780_c0_g1~~TRINITY_DN30780_c0_g1_i1.p1  ORF type:complete len:357 (+),score=49.64 TRINITY_DN30780_c0_g1_i1:53-1123(+)
MAAISQVWLPLLYSITAGLSTGIGGLCVYFCGSEPRPEHMAFAMAMACGTMIAVTVVEILLPTMTSQESIRTTLVPFVFGICLLKGLECLVGWIESSMSGHSDCDLDSSSDSPCKGNKEAEDTSPTSPAFELPKRRSSALLGLPSRGSSRFLDHLVSGSPRRHTERKLSGMLHQHVSFRSAVLAVEAAERVQNDAKKIEKAKTAETERSAHLALFLFLVLSLHNFPEGLAVTLSTLDNPSTGFTIMIAIALHNIPEGIAIAVPVYKSTGSRWEAIKMSLLSGLSEPLGAGVALFLLQGYVTPELTEFLVVMVGGIMFAVAVLELWPESGKYDAPTARAAGFATGGLILTLTHMVID